MDRGAWAGGLKLPRHSERQRGAFFRLASWARSPYGQALVVPNGRFTKVNPSLCRIIGHTPEELLATDFQTITHPDDLDADLEYVQQVLAGEALFENSHPTLPAHGDDALFARQYRPCICSTISRFSIVTGVDRRSCVGRIEKMSFRWKLFFAYLLVLSAALLSFYLWTERWLRHFYLDTTLRQLEQQARMMVPLLDPSSPELDALVDQSAKSVPYRITLIAPDGRVLADSSFSGDSLRQLENHRHRDEIVLAARNGTGSRLRYSTSIDEDLLYVAVALPRGEGFLRLAAPLSDIRRETSDLRWTLLWRALLIAAAGLLLIFVISSRMTHSIFVLNAAAREIAEGDFGIAIPVSSRDELGRLAESMRVLSRRLSQQVSILESERNHLDTVLRSMDEGVLVADDRGRIVSVNPALSRIFGLQLSPLGKDPLEVIRSQELHEGIQQVLKSGDTTNVELVSSRRILQARFAPILKAGGVSGVVCVFHDITELRALERVRKDFVSNVSHELRTPLTSIKGYTETLLAENTLPELERRFLGRIGRNADQLEEIVDALLDLSRLENQTISFERERTRYGALKTEMEAIFQARLLAGKMEMVWENKAEINVFQASESHLKRVLHNLIDNAIRYSDKGTIRVRVERQDQKILFSIVDEGTGITAEHRERVFERFYRVQGAQVREPRGSGIGLSIVKHIVRLHGGEVWLESEMGKGTAVFFTLPQAPDEPTSGEPV